MKKFKRIGIVLLILAVSGSVLVWLGLVESRQSPVADDGVVWLEAVPGGGEGPVILSQGWRRPHGEEAAGGLYAMTVASGDPKAFTLLFSDFSPAYRVWVGTGLALAVGDPESPPGPESLEYSHESLLVDKASFQPFEKGWKVDIRVQTVEGEGFGPDFSRVALGTPRGISRSERIMAGLNFFAAGVYLMVFFFGCLLYWGGRREIYLLHLAAISLTSFVKSMVNPNPAPFMSFWEADYLWTQRVDLCAAVVNSLLVVELYRVLYPCLVKRRLADVFTWGSLGVAAGILLLPYETAWGLARVYFQGALPLLAAFSLWVNMGAVWRGLEGSAVLLSGLMAYVGGSVLRLSRMGGAFPDGLVSFHVNPAQYGSLLFVMAFSGVVSVRYAKRFLEADRLSLELSRANASQEAVIEEKTKALLESEREKRRMMVNVSHDLKTPVTVILGYVEMLSESVEDEADRRFYLERIGEKTRQLGRLVEDLFFLGRLEDNRVEFRMEQTLLEPLLTDIARDLEPLARKRSVSVRIRMTEAEGAGASMDRARMERVFGNLTENALRHTPPGGRVELGAARRDGGILLWVKDDGEGIPPEDLSRIFGRYQRGRSMKESTTGLGLSTAKRIVEHHGGRIWAENNPGGGASFYIRLREEWKS